MKTEKNIWKRIGTEAHNLSVAGLVLLSILTVVGLFARWNPYLDWFAQFRAIYFGLAFIPLVVLGVRRHPGALAALLVVVTNGAFTVPWFFPTDADPARTCQAGSTALAINARGPASDHDMLIELIEGEDPDVLFVSELRPDLEKRIAQMFPHRVWNEEQFFGIGLYAKYPIESATYELAPNGRPTINAILAAPRGRLRVLGAHTSCPGNAPASENRNAMLRQIADVARESEEPVLLLGDLNVTMFSPHYAPLEEAGLRNARHGRGVQGTWPNFFPIRIPIDHVLTSAELDVCDLEVGEDFGSDHLPLRASFAWHATSRPPKWSPSGRQHVEDLVAEALQVPLEDPVDVAKLGE